MREQFIAELQELMRKYDVSLTADDHWQGYPECGQDANLIAAAPDMYEALEQAITSMLDSGYSTNSIAVKSGLQAILKAKGAPNETT